MPISGRNRTVKLKRRKLTCILNSISSTDVDKFEKKKWQRRDNF